MNHYATQSRGVPRVMSNIDAIRDPISKAVYISEGSARVLEGRFQQKQFRDWMVGK